MRGEPGVSALASRNLSGATALAARPGAKRLASCRALAAKPDTLQIQCIRKMDEIRERPRL